MGELAGEIRRAWAESVRGVRIESRQREMISMDIDEPLWMLSKHGCRKRDHLTGACPKACDRPASWYRVQGEVHVQGARVSFWT